LGLFWEALPLPERSHALKQFCQFLRCDAGLPKNRTECTAIQLTMVRYDYGRGRLRTKQDDMAALLTIEFETKLPKDTDDFSAGDHGKAAHTQTTWVSKSSSGTGWP